MGDDAKLQRVRLESGLELECIHRMEAIFVHGEMSHYFAQGIELSPGATVLDVGANIGMFSASAFERLDGDVRVFAFEPIQAICRVLERNARSALAGRVKVFPYGLGSRQGQQTFTFFPMLTVMSSSRRTGRTLEADKTRVIETLVRLIEEGRFLPALRALPSFLIRAMVEAELAGSFQIETHQALVRRLSSVLDEEGIESIDLLKIDVEGSELDVLHGIDHRHWSRIRQIVLEVESYSEREPMIHTLLGSQGFRVESVQDSVQRAVDFGMVYAFKR